MKIKFHDQTPNLAEARSARLSALTRSFSSLKHWITTAIFLGALVSSAVAGLSVQSGKILSQSGVPVVLRGINVPHNFFAAQTASSIANIAATGANSVRIVLGCGVRFSTNSQTDVANVIQLCKNNNLIAILEVQDTTGFGEQAGAASLDQAANYWVSIKGALQGQEDYVIVNLGNEPFGNNQSAHAWSNPDLGTAWTNDHISAIQKIRNAGINNALMVDAGNWGQDWQHTMQPHAFSVLNGDPQVNVMFSVHMYESYTTDTAINNEMTSFGYGQFPFLTLVVGEFGPTNNGGAGANVTAVMSRARQYGIGYLGWSWSGNGSPNQPLDITLNFNPAQLSTWGNTLINDANGITATSEIATIYRTISIPNTQIIAQPDGAATFVNITSNDGWTKTGGAPWINFPASGTKGNNVFVQVFVASDPTGNGRTGFVTLSPGHDGFVVDGPVITVIQNPVAISSSPSSVTFGLAGGTQTVAINGNALWSFGASQWIAGSPANGNHSLRITVGASATARTGQVTLFSHNHSFVITVRQQ